MKPVTRAARNSRAAVLLVLGALVVGTIAGLALAAGSQLAPPTLAATVDSPTNSTSATFTFSDSQQGVTFQCRRDGAGYTACASPKSYARLAAGAHVFQVRALSGKTKSSPVSFRWTIDKRAPRVTAIDRTGANPTAAAAVQWRVRFSEQVSGVALADFSLAASGLSGSSLTTLTGTGGTYTVSASTGSGAGKLQLRLMSAGAIVDRAGNQLGGALPFNGAAFTVDRAAPEAPTLTATPPDPSNSHSATFRFTDATRPVDFLCSLDGGAFRGCSSPQSHNGLADGAHIFAVEARDRLGNLSSATAYMWRVSTTAPPAPAITGHPVSPTTATQATFTFTDAQAGVSFQCQVDHSVAAWSACSSPNSYTVPSSSADVTYTFSVRALDGFGRMSGAASFSWTVQPAQTQGLAFTISGSAADLLYPGVWRALPLTLTNPNDAAITVTGLTVSVTSNPPGCDAATNIELQQPAVSAAQPVVVPTHGSVVVPASLQPRIRLRDLPTNQDACKNQTFVLTYSGSAHS